MNQTLIKKIKKMLPQEIRDIIKKEAELKYPEHPSGYVSPMMQRKRDFYFEAATKYAELMVEFAEWVEDNVIGTEQGKWSSFDVEETRSYTTSDLLTIFLKEKSK